MIKQTFKAIQAFSKSVFFKAQKILIEIKKKYDRNF